MSENIEGTDQPDQSELVDCLSCQWDYNSYKRLVFFRNTHTHTYILFKEEKLDRHKQPTKLITMAPLKQSLFHFIFFKILPYIYIYIYIQNY